MKKTDKNINKIYVFLKIFAIIALIAVIFAFFEINKLNYKKHNQIKENIVNHPENLPTKEMAKNTAFWFKNLRADIYRLQAIQYIWWNVFSADYKKYLYIILDLITELDPFFEHPYIIWQLLLPSYNHRYEDLDEKEQMKNIVQWEQLWLKWVKNFCNEEKMKLIEWEYDLQKLWTQEKYKNPCKSYTIPYYLAYIYYFYKKNPLKSALYYKIASANEDSLEWLKIMAAIMQWKWWDREKSFFMFINIAKFIESNDLICNEFAINLEKIWVWVFKIKNIKLGWNLIKNISSEREKVFWSFDEEKEQDVLSDTKCVNYVNKSIRELNLAYIEKANGVFKKDNNWESAENAEHLYEEGYIEYLPVDFQQYEKYWIIYEYNSDTWNFDYKMSSY